MTASKRFGKYKKEKMKEVRSAVVALKNLSEAWVRYLKTGSKSTKEDSYDIALAIVKSISYSSDEVTAFASKLIAIDPDRYNYDLYWMKGLFLSALINAGKESEFVINSEEGGSKLNGFGYKNTKNIVVKGNVADYLGEKMEGGRIVIEGDVLGMRCGSEMKDGEIIIEGNCSIFAGGGMRGGKIVIHGNAVRVGGHSAAMEGGEVHVHGEIKSICLVTHGKIYHKGKLRVDK
jgi:hypothetical protein